MSSPISLQNIRHQIDYIDDEIHDLLMRRADLVLEIAEEKKKSGLPIIQPAREIKTLRRLMTRHRGVLQKRAILQIWRELVGAVCLLQKDLRAVAYAPPERSSENIGAHDLARAYLGALFPIESQGNIHALINQLAAGDYECAIMPCDLIKPDSPFNQWWRHFIDFKKAALDPAAAPANSGDISITQRLPFISSSRSNPNFSIDSTDNPQAFLLTTGGFHPSGDDYSILACESLPSTQKTTDQASISSPASLREELGFHDLQLFSLGGLSTITVHEYIEKNDLRIQQARNLGFGLTLLGGYPASIAID